MKNSRRGNISWALVTRDGRVASRDEIFERPRLFAAPRWNNGLLDSRRASLTVDPFIAMAPFVPETMDTVTGRRPPWSRRVAISRLPFSRAPRPDSLKIPSRDTQQFDSCRTIEKLVAIREFRTNRATCSDSMIRNKVAQRNYKKKIVVSVKH